MKLKQAFAAVLVLLTLGLNAQVTINGVTLQPTITKDNQTLKFNGGGIRKKVFFKVYTAGLYLPEKSKAAADIVNSDKPVAIQLTITSSVINSSNMSEAIQEGFKKSLKGNTVGLQAKIDAFIETFKKENIKEGDVFELWYIPGQGVKSYKNGKYQNVVSGLDFKKALFGIWLSDTPVDDDLKTALLGS